MKKEIIHKSITKREMSQKKMKVQPVKKFMRNMKEVKISFLKIYINEICEGHWINDDIVGDDVTSVEEVEMRSSTDSENGNDDLISGFYASTCEGDNIYDVFENEDIIINEDSIFWFHNNKTIWKGMFVKIPYSYLPQN